MATLTLRSDDTSTTPTSTSFESHLESSNDIRHRHNGSPAAAHMSSSMASSTPHRPTTPPLLRAPPTHAFVTHVRSWGPSEIANFLSIYRCDQYTPLFHQNDIDGKVLLDLDMASLKEIGITKIGDRVKLLGGVRDLRKRVTRATSPSTASLTRSVSAATLLPSDGSPRSPLEHDARGSQVQKRLANANISKRLQSNRPPPLILQRPAHSMEGLSVSPSSRSVTPKFQAPVYVKSLTVPRDSSTLRPPEGKDIRRSPSPAPAHVGLLPRHNPYVSEPVTTPFITRSEESPSRLEQFNIQKPIGGRPNISRPRHSESPRDAGPPPVHPFASLPRTFEDSHPRDHLDLQQFNDRPGHQNATAHTNTPMPESIPRTGQLSLEEIRRHLVKFIDAEDGSTRIVNASRCTSGVEILEKALKKFNRPPHTGMVGNVVNDNDGEGDILEVDGWGVYIKNEGRDEDPNGPLSEAALLEICYGHPGTVLVNNHDPAVLREKGLLIKKIRPPHRKNMEHHLGTPGYPPKTPSNIDGAWKPDAPAKPNSKKLKRASAVSIMSALDVPGVSDTSPSNNVSRPPSNGRSSSRTRRMYNFFGHRPPSELISNNLADYFPSAKKRDLEKTFRQSMLRQNDRLSFVSSHGAALASASPRSSQEALPSPNMKVRPASTRTASSSTTPAAIPEESEGINDTRRSVNIDSDKGEDVSGALGSHPPLLPPFVSTGESLVDSLQEYSPAPTTARPTVRHGRRGSAGSTISRMSVLSSLRRNRDKSDNASLLTVDEITAEVENRRASMTVEDGYDNERPASDFFPQSDSDPESEESELEDDESDIGSDITSDEDGKGPGRAVTSTGSRRIIKWIKGALIGAGSFGSVYLGMDAQTGLLMAVKQVELPSGDAKNEERKKNMVLALEREIELLKELQHENIVQYLDSSTDGSHLNIFLEYVPGGSVAALLSNYGAFEEALVRNFVRQILMGLNYLHQREIIHRDIKGANILVDNKGGIKISDFGISKKSEGSLTGMRGASNRPSLQGSVFWMAPEVVKQTSYTSKADIWSVGCLVVEMLTGTHPWPAMSQMQAMYQIGLSTRPATPSDISSEATEFLHRTFEIDHDARPTASALLEHAFIRVQASHPFISIEQASATLEAVASVRNKPLIALP